LCLALAERPIVIVSKKTGACVQTKNLRTPSDWLFDTEQKSDEEGCQLGAAWIDRHGLTACGES